MCFYGHVDVMPAKSQDGWKTHPFSLTEIDGMCLLSSWYKKKRAIKKLTFFIVLYDKTGKDDRYYICRKIWPYQYQSYLN